VEFWREFISKSNAGERVKLGLRPYSMSPYLIALAGKKYCFNPSELAIGFEFRGLLVKIGFVPIEQFFALFSL
jgi:hypothetical protein